MASTPTPAQSPPPEAAASAAAPPQPAHAGEVSRLRAWAVRWRLAFRIARRDALRHRGRSALIVAMLALPAAAGGVVLTQQASTVATPETYVRQQLGPVAQAQLRLVGCPAIQTAKGDEWGCAEDRDVAATPLSPAQLIQTAGTSDTAVTARTYLVTTRIGQRAFPGEYVLQADPASLAGLVTLSSGRLPSAPGEMLALDWEGGELGLGQVAALETPSGASANVTVVGTGRAGDLGYALVAPGTLPDDSDDPDLRTTYLIGSDGIDWPAVQRLNAAGYVVVSRQVALDPPADAPRPGTISPVRPQLQEIAIVGGLIGIGVVEIALIVGPAFAVGAKRSRRTLALLGATGAEPRDQGRVVRAGGLLLGAVAGVAGAALGAVAGIVIVATRISDRGTYPNLVVPWPLLLALIAATALLGMAAAWFPARSVAQLNAAAALHQGPDISRGRRDVPWPGLAVLGVGVAAAVAGGATGQPVAAMAGGVALLIGIALLSGPIVALVVRLAPRLGVASRIALRDAGRHRSRTAPALAAVIACVAVGTLGIGYLVSSGRAADSTWQPMVADGLVTITADTVAPETRERALKDRLDQITSIAPGRSVKAYVADAGEGVGLTIVRRCPGRSPHDEPIDGAGAACETRPSAGGFSPGQWMTRGGQQYGGQATLVDDGTVIAASGLPGAAQVAEALRAGKALVNDPGYLAGGKAQVQAIGWTISSTDTDTAPSLDKTVSVPAVPVSWRSAYYDVVLPPAAARELGLGTWLAGYLLVPDSPLTEDQVAQINGLYRETDGVDQQIAAPLPESSDAALYLFAVLVWLLGAAVTWIAVGLAAADSHTDLATLAAVGAAPGTRRRFAGAQAGVIAGVGAVIGTLVGLLLLWVLVAIESHTTAMQGADWVVVVPWLPQLALAVGVPALAIVGAMLATRSRLPALTRRLT